jgi:hypothetical protein
MLCDTVTDAKGFLYRGMRGDCDQLGAEDLDAAMPSGRPRE